MSPHVDPGLVNLRNGLEAVLLDAAVPIDVRQAAGVVAKNMFPMWFTRVFSQQHPVDLLLIFGSEADRMLHSGLRDLIDDRDVPLDVQNAARTALGAYFPAYKNLARLDSV